MNLEAQDREALECNNFCWVGFLVGTQRTSQRTHEQQWRCRRGVVTAAAFSWVYSEHQKQKCGI